MLRISNMLLLCALCFLSACATGKLDNGGEMSDALYLDQVHKLMYAAWKQPSELAGIPGLVTRALVCVRQDGKIIQKKMVKASGNSLMDASVMAAVESVKKLPKLPAGSSFYKDLTIDFELSKPDAVNPLAPTNAPAGNNPPAN